MATIDWDSWGRDKWRLPVSQPYWQVKQPMYSHVEVNAELFTPLEEQCQKISNALGIVYIEKGIIKIRTEDGFDHILYEYKGNNDSALKAAITEILLSKESK